jgi:hypothetical protein
MSASPGLPGPDDLIDQFQGDTGRMSTSISTITVAFASFVMRLGRGTTDCHVCLLGERAIWRMHEVRVNEEGP